MASFGGVSFEERGSIGRDYPQHGAQAAISVRKIPGGDRVLIQVAGRDAATLQMPITCSSAQLASLRGQVGNQSTLSYSGGSKSAVLQTVDGAVEVKAGADVYFVSLILVVPP
jgi:hypothetical protein